MARHTQERRRQIVVNKPLQGRLILSMALWPAVALASIAVLTAVYCTRVMDEAVANDTEMPNMAPLFYVVLAFELIAAIYLMVNSLKISHRVAGPVYRICKCLERIRGGDLAFTVSLRDGDHLTEIRDEMNKLLDWLNQNPPPNCITRVMAASQAASSAANDAAPTPGSQQTQAGAAGAGAATAAQDQQIEVEPTTRLDNDGA
jgi:hypothetical protein